MAPLFEVLHGNVELRRVDHTLALKLYPDAIGVLAREVHVELHVGTAIRNERMSVDHIDQIVTRGEHVAPGADVLLDLGLGRVQLALGRKLGPARSRVGTS